MGNLDCEIYIRQLITFFESNPNDLMMLIGIGQKQEFFNKLIEQCEKNSQESDDHIITKQQMIDIVLQLKITELVNTEESIEKIQSFIQKTKWGDIILN
jgi:tetraacyldisaccharide-1-P 4'-kinase